MNLDCLAPFSLLLQLAQRADQFDSIHEMTLILQQHFVKLFRGDELPPSTSEHPTTSLTSKEEEMLLVVRAVRSLHTGGLQRHREYFQSASYHTSAAFFILEMLGALSGNRQRWFQQLQLESLRACISVVEAVGCANVRLCLPGIVSACVRYIARAHHGTDAVAVRTGAIELLRVALTVSMAPCGDDDKWFQGALDHLTRSLTLLLTPSELVHNGHALPVVQAMLLLSTDLLLLFFTLSLAEYLETPLVQQLLVACFVLENLMHLLGSTNDCMGRISDVLLQKPAVMDVLYAQMWKLQGIELLHFSSTLLRCDVTRVGAFHGKNHLIRVLQRCIHLVGTEMKTEDLYSAKAVGGSVCGVVDDFIESAAYASCCCAGGAELLAEFMDDCETTLADWDLYMLHPPVIYVLTRLVIWQFKTPAWASTEGRPAEELVLSCTFEWLWSVVAQQHLWNITEEEELCSHQQMKHRHTVAATILRFLELSARVLHDGLSNRNSRRKRAHWRMNVLVLYLVLEKAAVPGIVHDAAMRSIEALSEVGHYADTLSFFLDHAAFIVDEAARAVREETLRSAAVNVLRGGISFIQTRLLFNTSGERAVVSSTSHRWLHVPQKSLIPDAIVPKIADFLASSIKVACDSCRQATLHENTIETRASIKLLTDCFYLSAVLNRSVPQLGSDEEQERVTTAAEPRVQLLQLNVLEALQMLLAYCTRNDVVAPLSLQALTQSLTVFLTIARAEIWFEEVANNGDQPPPTFAWGEDADGDVAAVLPRSHLRTIYQIYLSIMAILTEPIAAFSPTNKLRERSAQELRALEDVRQTPAVLASLEALEALFILATEFLAQRVVSEVLPIVVTWYERAVLPRIPTTTDEKVRVATIRFIRRACSIDPSISEKLRAALLLLLPTAPAQIMEGI